MDKIYLIGQLYALLESTGAVTADILTMAAANPGRLLGRSISKAMRAPASYATIEEEVATIMSRLDPEDINSDLLSLPDQGRFWLGYYSRRGGRRPGAPTLEARVDWASVDWARSDAELSRELGVTRQAVRQQRLKREPKN